MQGDNLGVFGILWGTAIACALAAITMVDSGRKKILAALWVLAVAFLMVAVFWPWISETWPEAKSIAQYLSGNQLVTDAIGLTIFAILVFDFVMRRRSLAKNAINPSYKSLETHIEQVKGKLYTLEATGGTTRDINLLMHYMIYQSAVRMLDDLLNAAPTDEFDSPLQLGGDFELKNEAAKNFIDLVRRKLDSGSNRRSNFENIIINATSEAEREIEEIPMEQRPSGIDPLAIRRWAIIHRQCTRTVAFLKYEKKEAEENLLSQRHDLLQRYSELNRR